MKPQIIEIKSLLEAKPKYKTWYKYYNDILVSVICINGQKSYVRRKAKPECRKNDNEMCFWHSDWQYSKIEANYGIEKTGVKTYEITIKVENETHRIDSLISNVAIEFQHTLEVSLSEMDSRFLAHQSNGYSPYLVLDFTSFSLLELLKQRINFKSIEKNHIWTQKNSDCLSFLSKLRKWFTSVYYKNGNLIIDFEDKMIRLGAKLEKGFIDFEREYFINSILNLDSQLIEQIAFEKEEKRIEDEKKKEAADIEQREKKEEKQRKYIALCENNKIEIQESIEFSFYRQCLKENEISKILSANNQFDLIKYDNYASKSEDLHLKHHVYKFYNSQFNIPFFVLEYVTYNKQLSNKSYEYQYAEIILKKSEGIELRTIKFIKRKGQKAILYSRKYELIEGFLHSVNNIAYVEYNDKCEKIKAEYYLFNVKIDSEEEWSSLSDYCRFGAFLDETDRETYKETIKKFDLYDKWNFQTYFFENKDCKNGDLMPKYKREMYYEDKCLDKVMLDNYRVLSL